MRLQLRLPARELAVGDIINGFPAEAVEHVGSAPTGHARVGWGVPGRADGYYAYGLFVTLIREAPNMVPCPECGDPMSFKRTLEAALPITNGRCSECIAYPRRHTEQVERERRVAAYGEGRC